MKKFVPYYDGVLDQLLPEDRLIPYQVGWAEYVAIPSALKNARGLDEKCEITPGVALAHQTIPGPTGSQDRR